MKKILAVTTALFLMLCTITSYAAIKGPKEPADDGKTPAELNGYTEERWAALCDNNLEYEEIPDLVHLFNSDMDNAWNQMDENARDMKASVSLLLDAKKKTQGMYDDSVKLIKALPIPDVQKQAMIAALEPIKLMAEGVGTVARQYNDNYKKMQKRSSITSGVYSAEEMITYGVKSLMLAYNTVEANMSMLRHLVDLYQETADEYDEMAKKGLATATDVLKAQSDLISAQSNLAKLSVTEQQLYNQLITMCGWPAGADVRIGGIPFPDAARTDRMDPEADAKTAAGSNASIKALRSGSHRKSDAGIDAYLGQLGELESYIRANMKTKYADVTAARQGYEAACAGLEAARLGRKLADTQYKQGLTSRAQYLGTCIESVQKEAAWTTAVNSYEQAVLDYENALRGNVDAR